MSDIVRVLRIIEYVGPRALVERQVAQSVQGQRQGFVGPEGAVTIRAATIGLYPEILNTTDTPGYGPGV